MMDKDFELQGEAAERPELKKLTFADIPEGFLYAAVDSSGNGFAYYKQPFLAPGDFEWSCYTNDFKPIGVFDASDWQNSLVKRETAERPQLKKLTAADIPEGYRYAAVDASDNGFAYQGKPKQLDTLWVNNDDMRYVFIGLFDASDWKNSLVSREAAERAKPKKLTAADIPEGYNYAAVYSSGNTVAYKTKPVLFAGDFEWVCYTNDSKGIGVFDASDWKNSLVSRKAAERPQADAIKDQQDKPSFLEIDPNFLEAMAWRMTANKGKYPVNNWKGLTDRFTILDAIYRHANDIKRILEGGESLTGETIQKHCAAIACNAQFLFYHSPENQWERAARSRKSNAKEI